VSASVQTSAHPIEPDLFAAAVASERVFVEDCLLTVRGVLLADAEVVTRRGPDGADMPVLCVDVRPLSGADLKLHAELVFKKPAFGVARTKALTLLKGAPVAITTPLKGIRRDFLPDVRSVALLPPSEAHQ
jgi:hypothetical protein